VPVTSSSNKILHAQMATVLLLMELIWTAMGSPFLETFLIRNRASLRNCNVEGFNICVSNVGDTTGVDTPGVPGVIESVMLSSCGIGIILDGVDDYEPPHFFEHLSHHLDRILEEGTGQTIANLCYAFAVLDLSNQYKQQFYHLWSTGQTLDPRTLPDQHSRQLAQVHAFVRASGMDLQEPAVMLNINDSTPEPPRSQREVSLLLTEIGFDREEEVHPFHEEGGSSLPLGMVSIDMACRDRMVAIEFDGPYHFLVEAGSGKVSKVENGSTKAKRLFLEHLGWKVFNIHYLDWMEAKRKGEEKELLRMMLDLK
jgi:hypothetical protein